MKAITKSQAIELLSVPSSFVSFVMETIECPLNKGGKANTLLSQGGIDADKVRKHTTLVALCGTKVDYEKLVQNRLIRESDKKNVEAPDFTAESRKWGVRKNGLVVEHNGEIYITLHCVANSKPEVYYTYEGKEFNPKDPKFSPWFKPTKEEGSRQVDAGIEKVVVYRDYKLSSVRSFKIGGEIYVINNN